MKVQKYEISRTIDKLKSIVQKNDQFPALGGVLVKDGYLIASNTEMTMQLKLEASKGSCFIIPMKAFDVIKNLPDGEVIIDADGKNIVTIKTKAIKNKYQSYPPEEFSFDITEDLDAPEVVINGKRMMEAIGHVIYAAADSSSATQMMGVYFEGGENKCKELHKEMNLNVGPTRLVQPDFYLLVDVDDIQRQMNALENEVHRIKRAEVRRRWRYGRKKY